MEGDQVKYSDLISEDVAAGFELLNNTMKELKETMAALKTEATGLGSVIKGMGTATRDQQKCISDNAAAVDRLNKRMKDLSDEEQRLEAVSRRYKKLTDEQVKSVDAFQQAMQGTAEEQIKAASAIDVQVKSYNELQATYNALKDTLNAMTTAERESSQAGKVMTTTAMTIRDKMNELQKATGNYTLQVGKYKAAFDGLGFSFMQIAREAPSALNINQFFLAISNNLPMFFDQIDRFKTEQKEIKQTLADLAAQGKQTSDEYTKIAAQQTTVFKRLTTAVFSMQGAVLVFTLILRFLPKIVGWVKQLISGVSKWAQELVTVRRLLVQIDGAAEQALSKTRAEIELVLDDLNNATRGTVAFQNAVARLNELMGTSFDTVHAIPDEIKKATEAYIEQQRQLAINNKIVELYAANEMKKYAKQHISDGTFDSDTLAKLLGFDGDQAKEVAQAIEDYRTQIKTRQDAAEKLEAQWSEMRGNYGQGYANTTLAQLSQRGEYARLAKDPGLFNQLNGRSKYDIYTLLGQYESETSMKPGLWQRMWGIDTPAEKVNEIMDNVTDDTQAILDMYKEMYVAVPGSKKGDGGKKEDKPTEQDIEDRYWEAEEARIKMQTEGYEQERELAKLARDRARDDQNEWYVDQRLALDENLKNGFLTQEEYDIRLQNLDKQNKAIREGIEDEYWKTLRSLRMKNLKERRDEWKANADEVEKTEKENAKSQLKAAVDGWAEYKAKMIEEGKTRKQIVEAEVAAEIARLNLMLQLNRDINGEKMSDEQRRKVEEWIALLEKLQQTGNYGDYKPGQFMGKGGANVTNERKNYANIWEVLGIDMDSNQTSALNSVFDQAKEALNSWMDARKAAADQAKELADDEVSAAENALNREIELRNQGYANNVALRERELADAKEKQKQAMEEQKKIAQEQILLDAALQTSSLITASANIWKQFATQPWLAAAMLATMWGSFGYAKIKAYQASTKSIQFREGGVMLLEGGSHESGHDVNLGIGPDGSNLRAEGGEYFAVINKRNSRKYGSEIPAVVNALNSGMFEDRYIKTSDAVGLLPRIIRADNGSDVDLSAVESGVGELVKQGESRWTVEGEYRVERYKNRVRRVKIG